MAVSINLDEKSPEELKRLLDSVKTSNLSLQEKDEWVQKIQSKLGLVTRDPKREKELLAQIEAGAADIDDLVWGLLFIGNWLKKHLEYCFILVLTKPPFCVEISKHFYKITPIARSEWVFSKNYSYKTTHCVVSSFILLLKSIVFFRLAHLFLLFCHHEVF